MPTHDLTVEPARLREAERRVATWADRVEEHTSSAQGAAPRSLEAAARALDGSALSDGLRGVAVATARAGDGLVSALRSLAEGFERSATRYEAADRAAARRTRREDRP